MSADGKLINVNELADRFNERMAQRPPEEEQPAIDGTPMSELVTQAKARQAVENEKAAKWVRLPPGPKKQVAELNDQLRKLARQYEAEWRRAKKVQTSTGSPIMGTMRLQRIVKKAEGIKKKMDFILG